MSIPYYGVRFVEFSSSVVFKTPRGDVRSSEGVGFTLAEIDDYTYVITPGWKSIGWARDRDLISHGVMGMERVKPATLFADVTIPLMTYGVVVPSWSLHDLTHPVYKNALENCIPMAQKRVLCILGVPKPLLVLAAVKSGRFTEVVVVGNDYTELVYGPNSQSAHEAVNLGLHYEFIKSPILQFTSRWQEVRGHELRDQVDFMLVGLTNYEEPICKQIRRFSLDATETKYVGLFGPAYGATVLPPRPDFLTLFNVFMNKIAAASVDFPTMLSGVKQTDMDEPSKIRKPVVNTVVKTIEARDKSFKHWSLSPMTGLKASSCEVWDFLDPTRETQDRRDWAAYAKSINGAKTSRFKWARALSVDGPFWFDSVYDAHVEASKQITSKSDVSVHIGCFEGVSVNGWHFIAPWTSKLQICFDIGPYLKGEWGFPRLWNLRDNLKDSMHPVFGASQVTVPLVSNAFHRTSTWAAFVSIDGSHHSSDVLLDAENAWRMLDVGGVMYFDDVKSIGLDHITSRDRCNAARGYQTFRLFHAGEFEDIVLKSACRGAFIKKTMGISDRRATTGKLFDEGAAWLEDNRCGRQFAPNDISGNGSMMVDGEWFYDCYDSEASIALAGALSIPKALTKVTAGILDISANASVNIGNAWKLSGEYLGNGQADNAWAGAGQALKSVGRGFEISGQFTYHIAKGIAGFWVPQQYLQKV